MKHPIKFIFLLVGILFFTFTACQDEVIEETPPNQDEIIQPDSNLANLMRSTSANDGHVDNLLDGSDCFTVNLPVTIEANGITLTIETLNDLSLLEAIFDANNNDNDEVDFLFPITIILNNYTEINIESVEELESFIETCIADEDIIECANFVYPISFSIYNTSFQIIETVIVDNDYELYIFLEGLDDGNNGVVLASLNFPVSLQYTNGSTLEVNTNQGLEEAINAASENCDDDCDLEDVIENLQECHWNIVSYNNDDVFIEYDVYFNDNGSIEFIENFVTVAIGGNWSASSTNEGVVISITELTAYAGDLEGDWLVENCNDDRLVFTQQINSEFVEMVLEQNCEESPFSCFEDQTLIICDVDNDGFEVIELETLVLGPVICTAFFTPSFHETLVDAENGTNTISQPNAYVNTSNPQTIYLRIEALNGSFQVYEIDIVLEDCNSCNNPGTLTNDLIIYMPFGNEVRDLIGGTVINDFDQTEDRAGNANCAVSFNGVGNFSIPVTAQNQLVQGDNFSVSIWFKMQNTDLSNYENMFQKGEAVTEGFQLAVYDLNTPLVSDTTNGYGLWDNDWNGEVDVQWDNTDWHHLVVTRDSNNTIRLYRDGQLRNIDENATFNIDTDPLNDYFLGQFFTGHLDDLRVYKRTLNPNEVDVLFNLDADCFQCL